MGARPFPSLLFSFIGPLPDGGGYRLTNSNREWEDEYLSPPCRLLLDAPLSGCLTQEPAQQVGARGQLQPRCDALTAEEAKL